MRIYNTMTRMKDEFVPREEGKVAMYVCGPTVYNHIHIGNARTFISFDVIRRYLLWRGYDVTYVSNITDVDDKIINRANEEHTTTEDVAGRYTAAFEDVMHSLNVLDPTVRPHATQEIPEMIELVSSLIAGGHAYVRDGSVYFRVRSFADYGKLSGRDVDELRAGEREQRGGNFEEHKEDPLDFALWKAAKPGEPAWESPWGMGRPGWHIECSAMSAKYLGLPLDIHGGGADLVFPHHENEIAQSEASSGVTFSDYWMHSGMLTINSEKMSKSLGNFMLAKDVVEHYDPSVIRLLMLQTHYRSPLDWSDDRLTEASNSYDRIGTSVRNLRWAASQMEGAGDKPIDAGDKPAEGTDGDAASVLDDAVANARENFIANMDDDFNTAGALGELFTLVGAANTALSAIQHVPSKRNRASLLGAAQTITELLSVLGVELPDDAAESWPQEVVTLASSVAGYAGADPHEAVDALLTARADARKARDWATADAVRDGLGSLGFSIEDTAAGARVTYRG